VISIVLIVFILVYILYEILKRNSLCYKKQVSFHNFSEITFYEKEEPPNSKKVKLIIKTKV
jgi:hypothetical protein